MRTLVNNSVKQTVAGLVIYPDMIESNGKMNRFPSNAKSQTFRVWDSSESGPVRPFRINGRLLSRLWLTFAFYSLGETNDWEE